MKATEVRQYLLYTYTNIKGRIPMIETPNGKKKLFLVSKPAVG